MRVKKPKPIKTYKFIFYSEISKEFSYGNKTPSEFMNCKSFYKRKVKDFFYDLRDSNNERVCDYKQNKMSANKIILGLELYFQDKLNKAIKERNKFQRLKKTSKNCNQMNYYHKTINNYYYQTINNSIEEYRNNLKIYKEKANIVRNNPEYLMELLRS